MLIDFKLGPLLEIQKEKLIEHLPTEGVRDVLIAPNLSQVCFENAIALTQIYSFKKAIAVVRGNSPITEEIISWYLKEAYSVQITTWADLQTPEQITQWVESLKKETVFVLSFCDHPVTGEAYPAELLDQQLNQKKIFHIQGSYLFAEKNRKQKLQAYSSLAISVENDFAVNLLGERQKCPATLSQNFSWYQSNWKQKISDKINRAENEKLVLAFEKKFPDFQYKWSYSNRVYDRALLATNVHAGYLRDTILLQNPDVDPKLIATTNSCYWEQFGMFKKWWVNSPDDDLLRGLIIFDLQLIQRPNFENQLKESLKIVQESQSW